MISTIAGALACVEAKPYDFADKQTGQQVSGVAYSAYVVPVFDCGGDEDAVHRIRCEVDQYHDLLAAGFGTQIKCVVDVQPGNGRELRLRLQRVSLYEPVGGQAA